eukprot:CAMPEP_0117498120 /NCGR_PEP_ID=MMETSP0784-20121206/21548_1 /TAXON_ID=39447 /ORGANISM="" /LENGTH=174 /DNA_ID=CAMNT_0005293191 /DNA_START=52 /DNA_END=572 /DNA_ORIENTATION=-
MESDDDLRVEVESMNTMGGLQGEINYDEVAPIAKGMGMAVVKKVFSNLLDKRSEVTNPTRWVCNAILKERQGKGARGTFKHLMAGKDGKGPVWDDGDSELFDMVVKAGLPESSYEEVAQAAAGLDAESTQKVFSNLKQKGDEITNPTGWVCNALYKVKKGKNGKGKPKGWDEWG